MGLQNRRLASDGQCTTRRFQALSLKRGPPNSDHQIMQQVLENYGEITQRIYDSGDICFELETKQAMSVNQLQELCDQNEICHQRALQIAALN